MPSQSVRDRYVNDGAGVVSQPRLLVMLFDRLVLDVTQALEAVASKRFDVISERLCHAQAILLELNSALDLDAWDGAEQLSVLYLWLNNELIRANVQKDAKTIRQCLAMLTRLQEGWHGAYELTGDNLQQLRENAQQPVASTE